MKHLVFVTFAIVLALLGVGFLTSNALAQQPQLYLPQVVDSESVKLGNYSEIQPEDCLRLGLRISWRYYNNGTSVVDIAPNYYMYASELRDLNGRFFDQNLYPNLVIDSNTGRSRVCLYKEYNRSVIPNFSQDGNTLEFHWNNGVPNWEDNLWHDEQVSTAIISTTNYSVIFGNSGDSFLGAPVVGTVAVNGSNIGSIIQSTQGSPAGALIGGGIILGFVAIDALIEYFNQPALPMFPTIALDSNGSAIFTYKSLPGKSHFGCYANATEVYEMFRDSIIRLYVANGGPQGCLASVGSLPGEDGNVLHLWEAINIAALSVIAEDVHPETGVEYIPGRNKAAVERAEHMLLYGDDDPSNDPKPVPPPVNKPMECPALQGELADIYKTAAMYATMEELERFLSVATPKQIRYLIEFHDHALEAIPEVQMWDWYDSKRPRDTAAFYLVHLTTELLSKDMYGDDWTIEVVCLSAYGSNYGYILNVNLGRMRCGVTSTLVIPNNHDFVSHYEYQFLD